MPCDSKRRTSCRRNRHQFFYPLISPLASRNKSFAFRISANYFNVFCKQTRTLFAIRCVSIFFFNFEAQRGGARARARLFIIRGARVSGTRSCCFNCCTSLPSLLLFPMTDLDDLKYPSKWDDDGSREATREETRVVRAWGYLADIFEIRSRTRSRHVLSRRALDRID